MIISAACLLVHCLLGCLKFETTVRRISESGAVVYSEIEERHFRGGTVTVVNSMTVFEFNPVGKIRHLDVYLQQARLG